MLQNAAHGCAAVCAVCVLSLPPRLLRLIKLTKTMERLGDKVETCHKGQQKSWQAINEMQGRMQTIRDTVVRMTR